MWLSVMGVAGLWVLAVWAFGLPRLGGVEFLPGMLFVAFASLMVILVFLFYFTGQAFGGAGTFPGSMAMIAWVFFLGLMIWPLMTVIGPWVVALWCAVMAHAMLHFINHLNRFDDLLKAGIVLLAVLGGLVVAGGLTGLALGLTFRFEVMHV